MAPNENCRRLRETDAARRAYEDIFNPSTSWLTISAALLGNVSRDQATFKEFVLNFYLLLYESVSPRKRLLQSGLVTEAENRVIEVLKDFRNKWLVHDSTQGMPATVEENRRVVAGHLSWLGAARPLLTPAEYAGLQRRILEEIEVFLALLSERLGPQKPADVS